MPPPSSQVVWSGAMAIVELLALWVALAPQSTPSGGTLPPPLGRPPDHSLSQPIHPHGPPPAPPDGADVRVNSASTADQDETPIAVDPTNRLHLIAGANDHRTSSIFYQCAFYSSADGGLTWSELLFPDPGGFGNSDDPTLAIGPNGETWFCADAGGWLYVGQSFDGGVTVPHWVKAVGSGAADKDFMCADRSNGALRGALYVTWTHFNSSGNPIYMAASFDSGATWSTPKKVSDGSNCQGSCPTVGNNSELYVAFYDFSQSAILFDQSPDGGVTWNTDVKIADAPFIRYLPHTSFRVNSYPAIDVDRSGGPYNGSIYAVWATDLQIGRGDDVVLSRSTDGGQTWSTPIVVNDDTTANSQFFPWVAVDPNGNVNVGWLDRREDPNNVSYKYYVGRSSDGGQTFQPNVRVAGMKTNANQYSQGGFIGDYTGLAASDRALHPVWTDGRNGDNDVYTSKIRLSCFTDVPSISAATGGTANFTINPGPLYQNDGYRILGSTSGTSPGITLHHVDVPLNFDWFMLDTWLYANSSALPGFSGTLDATGSAAAALVTGPLPPAAVGLQMDFAVLSLVGGRVAWSSDATHLEIVP
jgi:hypothetical protein